MGQASPRQPRFPELRPLVHVFFRDLLALVRRRFGDPPQWPTGDFYDIQYQGRGTEQISGLITQTKREYPAAGLYSIWSEISALDGFQAASKHIRILGETERICSPHFADPAWGFLRSLALEYFARSRSCYLDEGVFDGVYQLGEDFLAKERVTGRLYIDLGTLKADVDELVLSPRHRVLRLDEDSAKHIWSVATSAETPLTAFLSTGARSPMPNHVILEATYEVESPRLNEAPLVRSHEFGACALGLRLCEPGGGAMSPIVEEYEPLVPGFVRSRGFRWPSVGTFSYTLDGDVATRITQAWPTCYALALELELNEANVPLPLRIAARRFGGSFEKLGDEDRLIDYMIALEALLGRENEAISYRIPLKLSTLAGASPLERARIFDVLRKAYSLRSALAHGLHGLEESVRVEGKDVPRKDFLLEVQGYLIRCIRLFIKARDLLIDKDSLLAMVEGAIVTQDRTDLEKQLCRWPGGRQS